MRRSALALALVATVALSGCLSGPGPTAMTVPQRAVLEGPQGKFVYVVDEKGTAQPRPVQAGEWNGQDWIIAGGLKPGDRVIVDGLMKLGPGAPVRIAQAQEGQQKPPAQKK